MILKQILSALLNLDDLQALCTSAAVQLIYELVQLKIARVGSAAELVRIACFSKNRDLLIRCHLILRGHSSVVEHYTFNVVIRVRFSVPSPFERGI